MHWTLTSGHCLGLLHLLREVTWASPQGSLGVLIEEVVWGHGSWGKGLLCVLCLHHRPDKKVTTILFG